MADVNDSINLLHIGNIFLQKGRIRDSYEYLKRAFESNPQENTYQSLIKVCGQLNLK